MTALCSGKICTIFPEKGALNFWKACTIALEYSELFSIRLNKKQSACNSQIEFAFELMNKSFLELDYIRQRELSKEVLKKCLSHDVEFIMIYIGMNR